MKTIYIVRHGQTQWNVESRMQGRLDSPLTDAGRQQASVNGALIKSLGGVEQLWVSPAGRTTETAFLINSYTQAAIDFADALLERDCGDWSGLTLEQIQQDHPQAWADRLEDPYYFAPPQGESLQDMLLRAHSFLDELFDSEWESVALVTHGVMSKVILKFYLGLSEIECTRTRHPNDLVYRLTFTAQDIETHHFIGNSEPVPGLLRTDPGLETYPGNQ
ncbi:MAG: phosphoglycerate mutase family protein [Pseudomonadaceae bacterium]|nr:phosphoglycerate mutase family protein [Pseudomonadaceae bacterium]